MKALTAALALALGGAALAAQEGQRLPLKKVSLFSSGVGYFEHRGTINGSTRLSFSFTRTALNDALKSLVINDAEAGAPQINYLSDDTLTRTLQSLKIDLSSNPGMYEILTALKGVEIIAQTRDGASTRGRIAAVDTAAAFPPAAGKRTLTLASKTGQRVIDCEMLVSFSFTDGTIQNDLERALNLIAATGAARVREIGIDLTGHRRRDVSVSYVISTPVWKISYRLDLNQNPPLLQSWAIVDNDGDIDWNGVEVSLVSGRPVSFVQALYPPYYTARPTLPLAGVGIAEAETHESGWEALGGAAHGYDESALYASNDALVSEQNSAQRGAMMARAPVAAKAPPSVTAGTGDGAAAARAAGEQFEFTLKKPVVLPRQQSAMLPLFDGVIQARKLLVFSGQRALSGAVINPAIGVELTNATGIKLPAGSMTVFDGGIYAGDALLDFVPVGEKRLVTYGEDLSVSGSVRTAMTRNVDTVKISKGLVTINRKLVHNKLYTLRNAAAETKHLVIEHPVTAGATLAEPASFSEQTAALYRFEMDIAGNQTLVFNVAEETPLSEAYLLTNLSLSSLFAFTNNAELSEAPRAVFQKALSLKTAADAAKKKVSDIESRRAFLTGEQERVRSNLQAAGSDTPEGRGYRSRLTALDREIDGATADIDAARRAADAAQSDYEAYISSLEL